MRIAFEVQYGIDHVLQHPRSGQAALLGDMADEDHAATALLGEARQLRRALPDLSHRARRGLQCIRPHGLDRVDHCHGGPQRDQGSQCFFEVDLGQQLHAPDIKLQAPRAQRDLLAGFLAGHVKHVCAGLGHARQGLQQQGRLADAGVAADQYHAARHQPAAQHAIEFLDARGLARFFARTDLGQRQNAGRTSRHGEVASRRRSRFDHRLDQSVPLPTTGALTLPLRRTGAALGAGILRLGLCHQLVFNLRR